MTTDLNRDFLMSSLVKIVSSLFKPGLVTSDQPQINASALSGLAEFPRRPFGGSIYYACWKFSSSRMCDTLRFIRMGGTLSESRNVQE